MSERTIPAELKLSDSHRQAILYIELLGLIHDLGKLTDTFLRKEASNASNQDKKYEYRLFVDPRKLYTQAKTCKTVHNWRKNADNKACAFNDRPDLTDTLRSVKLTAWDGIEYCLAELAPFLAKTGFWKDNDKWMKELGKNMQPGTLIGFLHGIGHFEKESSGNNQTQAYINTWRSTPFGYDEEQLPTGSENNLTKTLQQLPLSQEEIQVVVQSAKEREQWLEKMENGLSKGLADTRRPINDVTLWDWGYLVASLAKAAAHYLFHHRWPESPEQLSFRTLRINLDRLQLYAESDRITDLLGKQNAIEEAYKKVRQYLEFDLALGNRIHHDETGDYYLIPGVLPGEDPKTALRIAIQNIFRKESLEDCLPRVHFGTAVQAGHLDKKNQKNATRDNNAVIETIRELLVNPRRDARAEAPVQNNNNLSLFEDEWKNGKSENAERCSVCGLRPVGYPVTGDLPEVEKNLEPWALEKKAKERNLCRLCLNRRGRRAKKWAEQWAGEAQHSKPPMTIWTDEVADDDGRIALFVGSFGLDHWLDGSALETIRLSKNSGKNPSPARLFRITETARSFWTTINSEVLQEKVNTESCRIVLTPANTDKLDLGKFHTYELQCNPHGMRISFVWDSERGYFLSVENLNGLMKRHGYKQNMLSMITTVKNTFENKTCTLYQPSSYGTASSRRATICIKTANLSTIHYKPLIPLLAEPSVCMSLIPADKAVDVSLKVFEKYQQEMNRVQDRLPMGIGLVFFPRRTPIRAVMEAGRAMLNMLQSKPEEEWKVNDLKRQTNTIDLTFNNSISFSYKTSYGKDSEIPDIWHLCCFDSEGKAKQLNELTTESHVKVYPGRFDFEFLDTSGRRFDIYYDEHGRRPRNTRPFYLTDIQRIADLWQYIRSLSKSQIYQVIELIETKRTEWRVAPGTKDERTEVFRKFVQSTLAGAEWPTTHSWHTISEQETLVQAGVDGVLTDVAELYISILKSPSTENQKA